jgi:pimeloyl-ACP methyl ester carboxylesterase
MSAETNLDVTRGFVKTPHGHIEYREVGAGEPLVILHSTPNSSAQYQALFPYLSGSYRVIAPTTIGYGDSDRPPQPYTSVRDFSQSLLWFLDALELDRIQLLGSKTSSQIAIDLTGWQPQRVRALILNEPFNYDAPEQREVLARINRYYPERPDGGHLVDMWKRARGDQLGADLSEVNRRVLLQLQVNEGGDRVHDLYGASGWEGAATHAIGRFDSVEHARLIPVPTLVIHGTESRLRVLHEQFVEALPRGRGVLIDNTGLDDSPTRPENLRGQFFAAQAPEAWSSAILSFLDDSRAEAP